jgi:hypothetical protein
MTIKRRDKIVLLPEHASMVVGLWYDTYNIPASAIHTDSAKSLISRVWRGDNLDRILERESEKKYGAVHGVPFALNRSRPRFSPDASIDFALEASYRNPIDSIAVSGCKKICGHVPFGVTMLHKEHVSPGTTHFFNWVDSTIMSSRNQQSALYVWKLLCKRAWQPSNVIARTDVYGRDSSLVTRQARALDY